MHGLNLNRLITFLSFIPILLRGLSACNDSSSEGNVKVFKYSGLVQCQPDSRTPLEEMRLELTNAGIDVVCAQTGSDGLLRPAVCDAQSGEINIYQIRTQNLEDAENLGFSAVITLPEYQDQACD